MNRWAVFVEGLEDLKDFDQLGEGARLDLVRTINKTTARFRTRGADQIRQAINFPASYLQPGQKRLYVAQQATRSKPEGIIRARGRATSLARFVTGRSPGKEGVTVQVKKGHSEHLKRAFLVKLPAGTGSVDTQFNMGLAVRLRKGDILRNKRTAKRLARGLYLLYGPSVDQVFINATGARAGQGVASDMSDDILDFMQKEFLRLWELRF